MNARLDREVRLVLHAARVDADAATRQEIGAIAAAGVDWDAAIGRARREGVASLLHRVIAGHPNIATHVPWPARERLATLTRDTWARHAMLADAWAEATPRLADAGVRALTLKGMALAGTVYPDPALRPMVDIDLLVRPHDVPRARQALCAIGYRTPDEAVQAEEQTRAYLHFVRDRIVIDLRWSLARYSRFASTLRIDHTDLWERATPLTVAGVRGASLSAEHHLVYLALHLSLGSEFGRVIWFTDVDALIRHADIDWDRVVAIANGWRLASVVGYTLHVVREAFETPVPAAVMARLRPGRVRMGAVSLCLATRYPPSLAARFTGYHAYVGETLLMDRFRDVLAVFWRSFVPTRTWVGLHYGTASSLAIAWYRLVHPLRVCWLAARHLGLRLPAGRRSR